MSLPSVFPLMIALTLLGVPVAAQAGDARSFGRAPLFRGGGVLSSTGSLHSPAPTGPLRRNPRALQDFVAGKRLEARRGLRAGARDRARADRRAALGPRPDARALDRYRRIARSEERRDAFSQRVDIDAYERARGQRLGPATRRILGQSRVEFHLHERLRQIDREVEALGSAPPAPSDREGVFGSPLQR